jgi:uncharacterized protein (UPF0335 family)
MTTIGGISGEYLRQYIDRIERLEEEKSNLTTDIREVYAEAKANGFDAKIMRQIIKIRKIDRAELEEQETLLDIYKQALGMTPIEQEIKRNSAQLDIEEHIAAQMH